jgi:threonine dehydrogenase-like Zn-dependent dehydrogenase
MATMRALVKRGSAVVLCRVPVPEPAHPGDVRVRVSVAGLCRTDLLVAAGRLSAANPVTLGHEFAGTVDAVGPDVRGVRAGDRVAVNPVLPCGRCATCEAGDDINCAYRSMLGVDRDGAFAEFVVVPAANVVPVPPHVPDLAAAYAEPVAAALAVFNAGIRPHQKGVVLGGNRFARLVEMLLRGSGFQTVTRHDPAGDPLPDDAFDFVIETGFDGRVMAEMIRVAKPGGTLVLKSRVPGGVPVDFLSAVVKQLAFRAVNYGPFRTAVGLLAEGRLDLSDLLGPVRPLEEWEHAFRTAKDETRKVFLSPSLCGT